MERYWVLPSLYSALKIDQEQPSVNVASKSKHCVLKMQPVVEGDLCNMGA